MAHLTRNHVTTVVARHRLTTLASNQAALANVIFTTGFESSQGYALGQLQGQHGWSGSTAPIVENTTVYDGACGSSI